MNENIVFNELTPAEQENLSGGFNGGKPRKRKSRKSRGFIGGFTSGFSATNVVIGNVNLGKKINAIGITTGTPAAPVAVPPVAAPAPVLHPAPEPTPEH